MSEKNEKSFIPQELGQQGDVPRELNELGANHQHVAVLPLALREAHHLHGRRLEAVLPALVRIEVAGILEVQVGEHEDIDDDGELPPLARGVVGRKNETLLGFLRFVGWSPGSLSEVERLMTDSVMGGCCRR